MNICTECGKECEIVEGQALVASDEWGDQWIWCERSECCQADFDEKTTTLCWKCSHEFHVDESNCPKCDATSAVADPELAAEEMQQMFSKEMFA